MGRGEQSRSSRRAKARVNDYYFLASTFSHFISFRFLLFDGVVKMKENNLLVNEIINFRINFLLFMWRAWCEAWVNTRKLGKNFAKNLVTIYSKRPKIFGWKQKQNISQLAVIISCFKFERVEGHWNKDLVGLAVHSTRLVLECDANVDCSTVKLIQ